MSVDAQDKSAESDSTSKQLKIPVFDDSPNLGPPEISKDEIEIFEVIGEGMFGKVYRGRCRAKDVAVKILHRQELDEDCLIAFRKEIEIVSKIFHPNVVLFMGACVEPGSLIIVSELMKKGNLETILHNQSIQLSLFTRLKMMKDTALAMNWLHKSNPQVIHRDLKPSNLLIGDDFNIKVSDFGLSQVITKGETLFDNMKEAQGSPLWMPPEVLSLQRFDEKADIYAFGIILWETLTREEPYQEYNSLDEFTNAICSGARPRIPNGTCPILSRLMQQCWQHNPTKRPSFSAVIEQLDRAIVDAAIPDPVGRRFWLEYFPNQEKVSWDSFVQAFFALLDYYNGKSYTPLPTIPLDSHFITASDFQLKEFAKRGNEQAAKVIDEITKRESEGDGSHVDDISILCLKEILLGDIKDETVQMKTFGKALAWFGPVTNNATRPRIILLNTLYDTLSKDWFHGDIDQREAERRLAHRPQGTFLIRFSSIVGCFTVSKVDGGIIVHQRIVYQLGQGFALGKYSADTLVKLINQIAMKMGLYQCCPGSRYIATLFKNDNQSYSGYIQNQ